MDLHLPLTLVCTSIGINLITKGTNYTTQLRHKLCTSPFIFIALLFKDDFAIILGFIFYFFVVNHLKSTMQQSPCALVKSFQSHSKPLTLRTVVCNISKSIVLKNTLHYICKSLTQNIHVPTIEFDWLLLQFSFSK